MVSLGIGLQRNVVKQLMSLQALNELTVLPNQPSRPFAPEAVRLKIDDELIREIKKIPGVEGVVPVVNIPSALIRVGNWQTEVLVESYSRAYDFRLEEGRIAASDSERSIIVAAKLGNSLLESEKGAEKINNLNLLGRQAVLYINRLREGGEVEKRRLRLKIVGVATERGMPDVDYKTIYLPLNLALKYWSWVNESPQIFRREGYPRLKVKVRSAYEVDLVTKRLEKMGLFVFSLKEILGELKKFFRLVQVILGGIGAVALFVASLGIINTMVMSIYERTKEIGIMKAVGASNRDIVQLFLAESGFIGFLGGSLGVILGWLVAQGLNYLAEIYLKQAEGGGLAIYFYVPVWLIIFSLIFATVVGTVAGIYPALRAARLDPATSLRQE
jgi:putative ABC transport system permease protein